MIDDGAYSILAKKIADVGSDLEIMEILQETAAAHNRTLSATAGDPPLDVDVLVRRLLRNSCVDIKQVEVFVRAGLVNWMDGLAPGVESATPHDGVCGYQIGQTVYYTNWGRRTYGNGDILEYGQKGMVVDMPSGSLASSAILVAFEGNRVEVQCQLCHLCVKAPPPLPDGYTPGQTVYMVGSSAIFPDGDKQEYGMRGTVLGPGRSSGDELRIKVQLEGNKGWVEVPLSSVADKAPPALPRGLKLWQPLYLIGNTITFPEGDHVEHGMQGILVGLVTAGPCTGRLIMQFGCAGESLITACKLADLSEEAPCTPPGDSGHRQRSSKAATMSEPTAERIAAADDAMAVLLLEEETSKQLQQTSSSSRKKKKKKKEKGGGVVQLEVVSACGSTSRHDSPQTILLAETTDGAGEHTADAVDTSEASNAAHEHDDEVPQELTCPMTLEMMQDPVITADGQTYERKEIEEWLQTKNTSPLTGEPLAHQLLVPNVLVRGMCRKFLEKQKGQKP